MRVREWARREGFNEQTVWQWCRENRMPVPFERMSTGTIIIHDPKYESQPVAPTANGRTVCYARVSSSDQKDDLQRQADRLKAFAINMGVKSPEVVMETGSGMNDKRRKLNRLLADPTVGTLIVERRDRLARMNAGLVESAFNAAVPFRSQLISFSSLTDLKLFCEKSINDKVVIGSDNWLFYSMESDIDDYKGTNLFTEGQLAQIASQLTTSEQWLSNRGSEFVLMIAPNKETIYGEEHLPSYYKKAEETRTDQLIAYLKKNTDIRIVYPKEEMLKYKDEYSLYWHYDTHWNAAGGYIGAKALLKELGDELPEVEDITFTPDTFSGYDLARMMNLQSYYEKNMPAEENYIVTGYNGNNLQAVSIEEWRDRWRAAFQTAIWLIGTDFLRNLW